MRILPLMQRIYAKIAAIEEEEKANEKQQAKATKEKGVEVIGDKDSELYHKALDSEKKGSQTKLAIDEDDDDDDFFDDFFDN